MDRRDAVKNMAFLMGGVLSATTLGVFLDSCKSPSPSTSVPVEGSLFTEDQLSMITEVADLIIPATSTPGAKSAGVGPFIALMVKDCYPKDAQDAFIKGLEDLNKRAQDTYKKSFLDLEDPERMELMNQLRSTTIEETNAERAELDKQEKQDLENKKTNPEKAKSQTENANVVSILPKAQLKTTPRFFPIIRDLTLLGYFTSEIGTTKAMTYVEIPGRYDGCVDLKPGQKVWAS